MLLKGDCRQQLATLPDNSVHAIITDPPYELGFMGKTWDSTGIAYDLQVWTQCLRVLKPGGHLLAFGGSRTYHRLACAIEDAGFEIRDQIMWVYGSGFPKSLDVSKAIDKAAGAKREVISEGLFANRRPVSRRVSDGGAPNEVGEYHFGNRHIITAPATDAAKQWDGWGTALKPAHEPIVLARKPLDGTVANNVLTHGVGALNINGCRVGDEQITLNTYEQRHAFGESQVGREYISRESAGRWPANFIHDGSNEVLELFPDTGKSQGGRIGKKAMGNITNVPAGQYEAGDPGYGDSGSAARFFYCAKASRTERNAGLDGLPADKPVFGDDGGTYQGLSNSKHPQANFHPTVKPLALIHYLIKLITPPGGTILDPFLGSGTTAVAATQLGHPWIGCELTADYWPIIEARVNHAQTN
jgi:site-specific DNA-methyltransferase (adenine-specific)